MLVNSCLLWSLRDFGKPGLSSNLASSVAALGDITWFRLFGDCKSWNYGF